jgi:hypothetical protein
MIHETARLRNGKSGFYANARLELYFVTLPRGTVFVERRENLLNLLGDKEIFFWEAGRVSIIDLTCVCEPRSLR